MTSRPNSTVATSAKEPKDGQDSIIDECHAPVQDDFPVADVAPKSK